LELLSLDEAIDGRFDGIDQQATDLAELLGGPDPLLRDPAGPLDCISPAYLNALALRYYLVKLIRPLAYLTEVRPLHPGDHLELVAAVKRDEDYAEVLSQFCLARGVHYHVRWVEGNLPPARRLPANRLWRRCLARLSGCLQPPADPGSPGPRVVLCGNPRLLDPVCRELLARGCRLWWLHDRFAVRSWFRWRAAGVQQLTCHDEKGSGVFFGKGPKGAADNRLPTPFQQIDAHFRRVRPDALVLDEDATPLARAAVAVGRRYGATSLVVQHGVPYCRFGFTPLAADRVLVWGESSRQRLIEWGLPAERIRVTGSPQHDHSRWERLVTRQHGLPFGKPWHTEEVGRPRILLLTTVPPRDDRPDAVALRLTGRTYAQMLRTAFAAVAQIDGAELFVRLHPRSGDDPMVRALRAEFRTLRTRLVRRGCLEESLAGVSCVLSCLSSAGVEATLAGVPVIQLAPHGATGLLPHGQWGLAGTARNETELGELLARLAADGWRAGPGPDPNVFAGLDGLAAARIADEILAHRAQPDRTTTQSRHATCAEADRQALPAGYH
jgi:hypothetical protein